MAVLRYFHLPPKQNTVRETQIVDKSGVNLANKLGDLNKTTANMSADVNDKVSNLKQEMNILKSLWYLKDDKLCTSHVIEPLGYR